MNTIAERLKLAREELGLTQPELAAKAKVSQGTIGNIESGLRKRPRDLLAIASALGVNPAWLESGKVPKEAVQAALSAPPPPFFPTQQSGEPAHHMPPVNVPASRREALPEGYVRLEHLSPCPSMGPGASLSEPVHVVQHLDVLESWVRQKVGSADYDRVKILTGCGQSMHPTIHDQDLIFVDINQRTIDVPGIYVVDVYGRFLLKRALILSDGTLILKSDNVEEFPDEERIDLLKAADTITVAGRVKAWWTLRKG